MSDPSGAEPTQRVLAVVDRAMIVVASLGLLRLLVPPMPPWGLPGTFGALAFIALGIAGLCGRAPWRRQAYPAMVVATSAVGIWLNGPLAGAGAGMALGVMIAAALYRSRLAVVVLIVAGVTAVAARGLVVTGVVGAPALQVIDLYDHVTWVRTGVLLGVFLWVGTRLLETLTGSLETALTREADAYRAETATQAQLETSRRELDELEQIELVGRLAGGVAHDVNNALTAILAASEVLVDDVATPSQRARLTELENASQHAAELVRDLLWIGRKFPPTTEVTRLADTIETCRRRLSRMSRDITLRVEVTPNLRVPLAPERLEQILFWLIIRAHRSGIADLALRGRADDHIVSITLTGTARAFNPNTSFTIPLKVVRAQLSTSAAREVVEQAGGTLTMAEAEARLCVEITLPAAPPEVTPATHGSGTTALVVDDEPLVLGRLARLVARRGYRVLTAASLAEAWPLLDSDPDLLLTDLQLGDGRGEDLAIASYERRPARPIVVCSGFGADNALRERLRGAALTFLPKPFTREELERVLPLVGASP